MDDSGGPAWTNGSGFSYRSYLLGLRLRFVLLFTFSAEVGSQGSSKKLSAYVLLCSHQSDWLKNQDL